jgi:hypothetical protein
VWLFVGSLSEDITVEELAAAFEARLVREDWHNFLMHVELTRNYKEVNSSGVPVENRLLESLLPSLLYMRLGAFLDESLKKYIDSQGWKIPKPLRNFKARLHYLSEKRILLRPKRLGRLRRKRNRLAHEQSTSCTWAELEAAIQSAQAELEHLKLVGPRPKYEFFGNHSPLPVFKDMGIVFQYGLMEGEQRVRLESWGPNFRK